jgi:hypothetical protein
VSASYAATRFDAAHWRNQAALSRAYAKGRPAGDLKRWATSLDEAEAFETLAELADAGGRAAWNDLDLTSEAQP